MQYKKFNSSKSTLVHFDKCTYLCKCHLNEYKEHFYYSTKFPIDLSNQSSHGPHPRLPLLLVLTALEFHINASYRMWSFISDFLHFRIVPPGLIYIVVCIGNLFLLLLSSALLYGYVTICLSIHLQVHLVVSRLGLLWK